MFSNRIRKTEKINKLMIMAYGLSILVNMFYLPFNKIVVMMLDLLLSVSILYFMDKLMKHEPILHRSPIYYYSFTLLVTITVIIDGGYNSYLFPLIFFLPILYVTVNFSRRGSTAIGILLVFVIWFLQLQDNELTKLVPSVVVTLGVLGIPQVIGLLVKEYVTQMKRNVRESKINSINEVNRI